METPSSHSTRPTATESATFPQFAQLPAELRRKIWRRALPRRVVHLRLKMDMNAWNWATEGDWWTHYRVAADPFPVASPARALYHGDGNGNGDNDDDDAGPALLRVNVEARAEALHVYRRRLALDPATLQRCLETATALGKDGPEGPARQTWTQQAPDLLKHMCAPAGMPRFDARRDVLVWAGIRRWCSAGGLGNSSSSSSSNGATTAASSTLCALFEATCRAARHVVVEYDTRLDGPLRALARAIAADEPGLATLTLQTAAPETTRREPYWRGDFRVVAAAPSRRAVAVLSPRQSDAASAREDVDEHEEYGAEAAALLRRHHVVFLPSAPPVPEGGFVVLAVVTPEQLAAIASRGLPSTMAIFMDSALAHTFAGTLMATQWTTDEGAGGPEAVAVPGAKTIQSFHGFCDPDYGLP